MGANYQAVGAFLVGVDSLNLSKTVNLITPQSSGNRLSARLAVYPEPKLSVGNVFNFNVDAAKDDLGNSLMRNSLDPLNILAPPINSLSDAVEVRLLYPDHPGEHVALLRGHLTVLLAKDYRESVFDDVLGTPTIEHPIDGCDATLAVNRSNLLNVNTPNTYRVALTFSRAGVSDDQWNAMISCKSRLTMQDADGHALSEFPEGSVQPMIVGRDNSSFVLRRSFSAAAMPPIGNQPAHPKTGDPVKLIWTVPTSCRVLNLPLSFKDLPMP
jgi:hypothetical protein